MRIGIHHRLFAALLDAFVLFGAAGILVIIVTMVHWSSQSLAIGLSCTCFVCIALCTAEVWLGASFGKFFLGLTIADATGRPSRLFQRLLRFSVKFFPLTVLFLASAVPDEASISAPLGALVLSLFIAWIVGYCLALGKSKQALHDRIAGTVIVDRDSIVLNSRLTQTDVTTHCALIGALKQDRENAIRNLLFR